MDPRIFEAKQICQRMRECRLAHSGKIFNQQMLVFLAVPMCVPAGSIFEVQVVGHFDEPRTGLDQSPCQQTALTERTAVSLAGVVAFGISLYAR